MTMNQLRRDCYIRCCWKFRKRGVARIRNLSSLITSDLNTSRASLDRNCGKLRAFSEFSGNSNRCLNSSTKTNGIGSFPSTIQIEGRRLQLPTQLRYHSTNNNDEESLGSLTLEKAAFASKEIVERRFLQSVETAVWKSSTDTERKKMYRFFFPQMRKAANDLLNITRDFEMLSDLIEKARENKESNTTKDILVRQMHSSFLQLTQIVLDTQDVAMESEKDQDNSELSLQMLELVLSLANRTHQLGLDYHRPLYQRLALAVAKHPMTIGEKTLSGNATMLGSLVSRSRAEWIQTILNWLRYGDGENGTRLTLESKCQDVEWFHPSLKILADDGRWPDVFHILSGIMRSEPESITSEGYCDDSDIRGSHGDFEDSVFFTSAMTIPYLDEDLLLDLLIPMEKQGLLREVWGKGGSYSSFDTVVENIIFMLEPSIWNIFHAIPGHLQSTVEGNMSYAGSYNLQDAIALLLKYGARNSTRGQNMYDDGREHFSEVEEEDSLVKALSDLEDILDEHLDLDSVKEGDGEEMNESASDSAGLTAALNNKFRHEDSQDNLVNNLGTLNFFSTDRVAASPQNSEALSGVSKSEHVAEKASHNYEVQQTRENLIDSLVGDEYLDFIYDDRAVDYEDNIPDITRQIYQSNGNQQLRYSIGLEYQIFEGLRRPDLHFDDEDDFVF